MHTITYRRIPVPPFNRNGKGGARGKCDEYEVNTVDETTEQGRK